MKLSDRLRSCAGMVRRGGVAADVGTDHGYLALYLLETEICPRVFASDLREGPLAAARRSAAGSGVSDRITLVLSDGLSAMDMGEIDTVIIAGMGGDTIRSILDREPGVRDGSKQLILQPQSKTAELRQYLDVSGFRILREILSRDGRFLYTAMEAVYDGVTRHRSPGQSLVPDCLRGDPLYRAYLTRERARLERTMGGLGRAREPDPSALAFYESARLELEEMEEAL